MAPTEHARLSPSGSKLWIACPGQPTLGREIENPDSEHSVRGTLAHTVLEKCLLGGFNAADFRRDAGRGTPDFEDDEAVQVALDWIRGEVEDGDEFEVEERLKYSDDLWGTNDFNRYRPSTRELLLVDYKNGAGVMVDAINNPQGIIYLMMKLRALGNRGVSRVRFVIIQPRGFHAEGPVREFEFDTVDMLEMEDAILAAVEKSKEADAAYVAPAREEWVNEYLHSGSHCRSGFCHVAATCPRLRRDVDVALDSDFAPMVAAAKAKQRFTPEQLKLLAEALPLVDRVKGWAKTIDELGYRAAEQGEQLPGWKLVRKKATQRWVDEGATIEFLEDGMYAPDVYLEAPSLKSPAQIRALLVPNMEGKTKKAREIAAKAALAPLTQFVSSGHTLVPETDPREPIRPSAEDDFEAVVEGED